MYIRTPGRFLTLMMAVKRGSNHRTYQDLFIVEKSAGCNKWLKALAVPIFLLSPSNVVSHQIESGHSYSKHAPKDHYNIADTIAFTFAVYLFCVSV